VPATATKFFASNRALARDLLAAIEENRPPVANGYDAVAALEMVMAVYEAHGAGQRVMLPLAERTHPLDRWMGARTGRR
jgi:predicted dehydrogenase